MVRNDYDAAREAALKYRGIFGEGNFYLELQDHGIRDQQLINPSIIRLSEETGIPLVVTNDCHYIEKEDSKMHHILLCIQTTVSYTHLAAAAGNEQTDVVFLCDRLCPQAQQLVNTFCVLKVSYIDEKFG